MRQTEKNHRYRIWIFTFLLGVLPFLMVALAGALIPSQYDRTYYGEMREMVHRLRETEGKRVVVVGNSGVAFGINPSLATELLGAAGMDYTVCSMGLYGSLGTRCMLELAKDELREGDILILSPEFYEQSLSMYFSAREIWYALDGEPGLIFSFGGEERRKLTEGYLAYAAEKSRTFFRGEIREGSGIYAKASFDEFCGLTQCERDANQMSGGADRNAKIVLDASLYQEDFVAYVNEYGADLKKRGVQMYYSFAPMNRAAVLDASREQITAFSQAVRELFDFPVIGSVSDSLMEKEWFYDSNFHLNDAGMILRTVSLVNELKNQMGNTTKTEIRLPEKPVLPDEIIEGEGDNRDQEMFFYELREGFYIVTGLTGDGAQAGELTVPYQVDGIYVREFLPEVFAGNTKIQRITLQSNIRSVADGSFSGCTSLAELVLSHEMPSMLSIGYGLLDGVPGSCRILVPEQSLMEFSNNYFWNRYADRLYGTEVR